MSYALVHVTYRRGPRNRPGAFKTLAILLLVFFEGFQGGHRARSDHTPFPHDPDTQDPDREGNRKGKEYPDVGRRLDDFVVVALLDVEEAHAENGLSIPTS